MPVEGSATLDIGKLLTMSFHRHWVHIKLISAIYGLSCVHHHLFFIRFLITNELFPCPILYLYAGVLRLKTEFKAGMKGERSWFSSMIVLQNALNTFSLRMRQHSLVFKISSLRVFLVTVIPSCFRSLASLGNSYAPNFFLKDPLTNAL